MCMAGMPSPGQKGRGSSSEAHARVPRRRLLRGGPVFVGLFEHPPVVFRAVIPAFSRWLSVSSQALKLVLEGQCTTYPTVLLKAPV